MKNDENSMKWPLHHEVAHDHVRKCNIMTHNVHICQLILPIMCEIIKSIIGQSMTAAYDLPDQSFKFLKEETCQMKKLIALAVLVAMLMSCASAFAVEPGSGGITLPIVDETVTYTFMTSEQTTMPFLDSFVVLDELEKRTNVHLDTMLVADSNYKEKLSVTLASGSLPDFIAGVSVSTANTYGPQGMFLNIYDYLDYMPNLSRCLAEIDGLDAYMYSDHELYVIPVQMSPDSDPQGFGYWKQIPQIRLDVLDELGLEVPTTFEELFDVLTAIKAAYPGSYPWVQGPGDYANNLEPILKQVLVAWNGDVLSYPDYYLSYNHEEGQWALSVERDGFKEMIEYLAKCYADGLLDPEFLTTNSDQWSERLLNNKGFFTYSYWNNSERYTALGRQSGDDDYLMMGIIPPVENGTDTVVVRPVASNTNAVSATVENPEILLQFIDYWLYSYDGTMIANAGVEGVSYEWADADHTTYKLLNSDSDNPTNEENKAKYGTRYGYMTGLRPDHLGVHAAVSDPDTNISYQQMLYYKGHGTMPAPIKVFTNEEDTNNANYIGTQLRDYIEQSLSAFITGSTSMDQWDQFIETCKIYQSDELVALYNK